MRPEPKPATSTKEQRDKALQDQLTAIDRRHTAALAELDRKRADAAAVAATDRAAAEAAHVQAERAALKGCMATARAKLEPFPPQWTSDPSRTLAGKIGSELAALRALEARDVGASGSGRSLATEILGELFIELAARKHPGIVAVFARAGEPLLPITGWPPSFEKWGIALRDVERAVESPLRMESALRAVEEEIESVAESVAKSGAVVSDELKIRWKLLREHDRAALEAFDRARMAAQSHGQPTELARLMRELAA